MLRTRASICVIFVPGVLSASLLRLTRDPGFYTFDQVMFA